MTIVLMLLILNLNNYFFTGWVMTMSKIVHFLSVISTPLTLHKKTKFSIKDLEENADLVTFTDEILNGKLHFLCSANQLCATDEKTSCSTLPITEHYLSLTWRSLGVSQRGQYTIWISTPFGSNPEYFPYWE